MTDRQRRYSDFDDFHENSKEIFEGYAKIDPSNKRLKDLFNLCITPGGRNGGLNKKVVEVFYGNRPFDAITTVGDDHNIKKKLETAHGATLKYDRTDSGHVMCFLYPAMSENQRPLEDAILLDYVSDPSQLKKLSKKHWKMFIAYMEHTCIDGEPNICHKIRASYLLNFKECRVDSVVKPRKVWVLSKEMMKFSLTVGLSGFIILIVTWAKDDYNKRDEDQRYQQTLNLYKSINANSILILKSANQINETIIDNHQGSIDRLNKVEASMLESNKHLDRAVKAINDLKPTQEIDHSNPQILKSGASNKSIQSNVKPRAD